MTRLSGGRYPPVMSQPQPCGDDNTEHCPRCGAPQPDLDARLAGLDPADPALRSQSDVALGQLVALTGAPSLGDYRRVYDIEGLPWPGDDEIRARYPVASAG